MTQSIRDAAQALVDACDGNPTIVQLMAGIEGLRAALSAPQPTADERVSEHMRLVDEFSYAAGISAVGVSEGVVHGSPDHAIQKQRFNRSREAVEQSARALLSASQEDAEHAAMYRWLREHGSDSRVNWLHDEFHGVTELMQGGMLDDSIRAAMSAKETK